MKILKYLGVAIMGLFLVISCEKDKVEVDTSLTEVPLLDLPMGEEGSLDRLIYDINEKYSVAFYYDFTEKQMQYLINTSFTKYYTPCEQSDETYIRTFINHIVENIFEKNQESFVKKLFPRKIFLVDTLGTSSSAPTSSNSMQSVPLSNSVDAIFVPTVSDRSDSFTETNWVTYANTYNQIFALFYYSAYPLPNLFLALRGEMEYMGITDPEVDPDLQYTDKTLYDSLTYTYRCKRSGYIKGWNGTTYVEPNEDADFADFVNYLTTTPATTLKYELARIDYDLLRQRAIQLYIHLKDVVGLNVIATQNINCPDDKLEEGYFESIRD